MLRDITRNISNGISDKIQGLNVVVIDERGEISSIYRGIMQNDLGIRTDVINDIPKSIGMKIAIRSMAPQVLIADEIGSVQDSEVIKYAVCCGVKGIFTAHGNSIEDVMKNPELKELIQEKIFEKVRKRLIWKQTKLEDSMQPPLKAPFPKPDNREQFWSDFENKSFEYVAKKYGGIGLKNDAKLLLRKIKRKIKKLVVKGGKRDSNII